MSSDGQFCVSANSPARGESLLLGVVPTSRVDDENRADRTAAHLVIGTVLAVVAIWGVLLALYGSAFPNAFSDRQEVWGQFGDFVGGVLNPILGTLTLGGVVYTIALQRRLLSDTRAIAQSQRIVDQHQAFEAAVFHLMGAIDRRGSEARLVLDGSTVASMKTDTPYTRPYMLKGGDREGTTGEFTFHGHDAFHAILAKISWEVLTTIPGARQRGDDIASFRRITALRELEAYDYAVGPSMRQLCDVLQCCQAFEPTFERAKVVGLDALNPPSFYARMAANSLPVEELATFALYVGAGLGGKGILVATERYELFRSMPLTWVSDYVPNSELL